MAWNETENQPGKASLEETSHPFLIRIWLEETAEEAGRAVWRGHVTHVPTGDRCYLSRLRDILGFIIPYLEQMGVRPGLYWRARRWLKRRRFRSWRTSKSKRVKSP